MVNVIILAGGLGTRMKSNLPKVLVPLNGKPIVSYLLNSISDSRVCTRPTLLVGHQADLVEETLGPKYEYVLQKEQLGTGHAVKCALTEMSEVGDHIMVLYGDHAFLTADSIMSLAAEHQSKNADITLMTLDLPDYDDWRQNFMYFGRIVRDSSGKIQKIVEYKDATEEERKGKEVNPAYFCFKASWLKDNIEKISNNNLKGEYYLTDLIHIAMSQGDKIESIYLSDPIEGMGVNTPEELDLAKGLL